ncbi:MAG: sigma factor-like helix-turn-helix DNA-binding protein [bacterium]
MIKKFRRCFIIKSKEILEKIKILKARQEVLDLEGEKDPEIEKVLNIFEACKSTLTERQKQVLELFYIRELNLVDTAAEMGWSKATVRRDLKKIRKKFDKVLENGSANNK